MNTHSTRLCFRPCSDPTAPDTGSIFQAARAGAARPPAGKNGAVEDSEGPPSRPSGHGACVCARMCVFWKPFLVLSCASPHSPCLYSLSPHTHKHRTNSSTSVNSKSPARKTAPPPAPSSATAAAASAPGKAKATITTTPPPTAKRSDADGSAT